MGPVISPTQANRILTYCQRVHEAVWSRAIPHSDYVTSEFMSAESAER